MSRPLITVPTTLPRSAWPARVEVMATMIWATTAVTPRVATAAANRPKLGAAAARPRPAAAITSVAAISLRRSSRSPSGTSSASPTTYPAWLTVTSSPAELFDTENACAIVCSRGCA